jgi:NF-kappa-B-activating protein
MRHDTVMHALPRAPDRRGDRRRRRGRGGRRGHVTHDRAGGSRVRPRLRGHGMRRRDHGRHGVTRSGSDRQRRGRYRDLERRVRRRRWGVRRRFLRGCRGSSRRLRRCGRRRDRRRGSGNGRRRRRRRLDGGRRYGRWHRRPRRQQPERIDVTVGLGRDADAEVDERIVGDGADSRSFLDRRSSRDAGRAEVRERDGIPVRGRDRDGLPIGRHASCERDRSGRRCNHRRAGRAADRDAAALAAGVRVIGVEGERLLHGAVDRPRPRTRRRREERCQDHYEKRCAHTDHHLVVRRENVRSR